MKTVKPKTQKAQARKRTTKQIRFRQYARKVQKAWKEEPERIQKVIDKILGEYEGKQMDQQLLLVYAEMILAIYKRTIREQDALKYDMIHSFVSRRKAEILAEVFFQGFLFQWKNKYWATKLLHTEAIMKAQKIIRWNLSEGSPGDDHKLDKMKVYRKLQDGIFPNVAEFNPVDIAEVMSGIKSIEYLAQELSDVEKQNTILNHNPPPSNLIIQLNQNDDGTDLGDCDESISINIPIMKIAEALSPLTSENQQAKSTGVEEEKLPELYNREQTAEICQVTPQTIYNWATNGILEYVTLGPDGPKRYRREDLEAFMIKRNKMIRR